MTHVFRVPGSITRRGERFLVRVIVSTNDSIRQKTFRLRLSARTPGAEGHWKHAGIGVLSGELAEEILEQLDVSDFSSNLPWRDLGMVLHACSGGDADVRDVFLDWSEGASEKDYSREKNESRWNSFRLDKPSLQGLGTLIKICREHGVRTSTIRSFPRRRT